MAPHVVLSSRTCVSDSAATADCDSDVGLPHAPCDIAVTNEQNANSPASWWAVQSIVVPPDTSNCGNDFALLILSDVVDASEATPLAPRIAAPVTAGDTFAAYGYGGTDGSLTGMGIRWRWGCRQRRRWRCEVRGGRGHGRGCRFRASPGHRRRHLVVAVRVRVRGR